MKRYVVTINIQPLSEIVEYGGEQITVSQKLEMELNGFFNIVGNVVDGRCMAYVYLDDINDLKPMLPDNSSMVIIGGWERSGFPIGQCFDDNGVEVSPVEYSFNKNTYLKYSDELKMLHNISGWADIKMEVE
jgi:hypothetical protein